MELNVHQEGYFKETMKKVCSVIVDIVTSVLLIVALALVIPQLFGIKPKYVLSPSMTPTYPTGSLVYIKEAEFEDIKVSDVITFNLTGSTAPVTHRVVEIFAETQEFRTKGDANDLPDGQLVSYKNVLGTVRFGVPVLGFAIEWIGKQTATTPGKIIAGTACVALVLLFFLLETDSKEKKKNKAKSTFVYTAQPVPVSAGAGNTGSQGARYPLPNWRSVPDSEQKPTPVVYDRKNRFGISGNKSSDSEANPAPQPKPFQSGGQAAATGRQTAAKFEGMPVQTRTVPINAESQTPSPSRWPLPQVRPQGK